MGLWKRVFCCLSFLFLLGVYPLLAQQSPEWYFERGRFELSSENYAKSLEFFKKAIELDPINLEYKYHLGLVYSRLGRPKEAISILESLIAKDPIAYRKAYLELGLLYTNLEEFEKALSFFEKAEKVDPKNASIQFNKGICLLKLERYEKAISSFEKARSLEPKLGQIALYHMGFAYYKEGKYTRAEEELTKAISLDPQSSLAQDAKRLQDAAKQERRAKKRWYLLTSLFSQYDDNVYFDPMEEAGLRRRGIPPRDEGDFFTSFNLIGGYRLFKTPKWEFGGQYSHVQYIFSDLSDCNLLGHIGSLYASYAKEPLYLRTQYNFSYYYSGGDLESRLRMHDFSLNLTLVESPSLRTEFLGIYQNMRYLDGTPDAYHLTFGITQFLSFSKGKRHIRSGYKHEFEVETTGGEAGYRSHEVALGFFTPLIYKIALDLKGSYTFTDYDFNESFSLKKERDDERWQVSPLRGSF